MSVATILVIGSGGREHALATRLATSPGVSQVIVNPGNAGTASHGKIRNQAGDPVAVAESLQPGLVVVGPEAPLCDGLADSLRSRGFAVYGPSAAAAQLEASKAFMKRFADRHGIRTARYQVVTSPAEVVAAVRSFETPPVVKADGLCAGKGVVVAKTFEEAEAAALFMLSGEAFGEAGKTVVIEETISGAEASIHAITDGNDFLLLPAAQDHKRIGDGDTGPNTGGMGAYAPASLISPALQEQVRREIMQPIVHGMHQDGATFVGTVFAGLMIRQEAGRAVPYLLEINVRFGDPETQVLMSLIDGDFAGLLLSAAQGRLEPARVSVAARHALCVVLAAKGYPEKPETGDALHGLAAAQQVPGVSVYHAGTSLRGEDVVSNGGRVLGVVGVGETLRSASAQAYAGMEQVTLRGGQYRRDIGHRELGQTA